MQSGSNYQVLFTPVNTSQRKKKIKCLSTTRVCVCSWPWAAQVHKKKNEQDSFIPLGNSLKNEHRSAYRASSLTQPKQITRSFAPPSNKAEDKRKSAASDDRSFTQRNYVPQSLCFSVQVSASKGRLSHFFFIALFARECHLECSLI